MRAAPVGMVVALAVALAWFLGSASGSGLQAAGLTHVAVGEAESGGPPEAGSQKPEASSGEVIAEVRVHGNVTIPDEEVLRLAGIAVGDALGPDAVEAIERRLRESGRFESVDVRKRYRSLDMKEVALVLIVHEHPGAESGRPAPGPLGRLPSHLMVWPILGYDEGYGFTYGARLSTIDLLGADERISFPLSRGGTKQAAVEVERAFRAGPVARVFGRAGIRRRENPHYEVDDRRVEFVARAEHAIARPLRVGVEASRANVEFGVLDEDQWTFGVDVALDTRGDPAFPGNAVLVGAGWTSLNLDGAEASINRYRAEARGYVRVIGQSVVALRALYDGADRALPPYEQPLLGGILTLRGHDTGAFVGDRMLATSVEIRLPLDSPVGVGKAGFTIFYDAGKAWNLGERFDGARLRQGAGVGVFLNAPFVRINLDAAANLNRGGGRLHFAFGFSF